MKKYLVSALSLLALAPLPASAANLFVNGDFENVGNPGSPAFTQGFVGGLGTPVSWTGNNLNYALNAVPAGWTLVASGWDFNTSTHPNTSPDLISFPGITVGVAVMLDTSQTLAWGTSVLNEGTGKYETSVARSGSAVTAGLSQTVSGLSTGQQYQVTFSMADASSNPLLNKTAVGIEVWIDGNPAARFMLGAERTPYGFKDINYEFLATSDHHVITFVPTQDIIGPSQISDSPVTAGGDALATVILDNVQLSSIPEPSAMLLGMLGGLGILRRRR